MQNKKNIVWSIVLAMITILVLSNGIALAKARKSVSNTPPLEKTEFGKPMSLTVLRLSSHLCEPNCPEWIAADGEITDQTPGKLAKLLANPDYRKLPIVLNSGGGKINAAMAMGRMIRKYGMNTAVAQSASNDCSSLSSVAGGCPADTNVHPGYALTSGGYCNSACSLVLLGGVVRIAGRSESLGLHQPHDEIQHWVDHYWDTWHMVDGKKIITSHRFIKRTYDKPRYVAGVTPQMKPLYLKYFKEMGGSPQILDEMAVASPANLNEIPYVAGGGPRQKLGLVTMDDVDLNYLVSADHCKTFGKLSSNCVYVKEETALAQQPATVPCFIQSGCGKENEAQKQAAERITEPEMTFFVMRLDSNKCLPQCPEWVQAYGKITKETPKKLEAFLSKANAQKFPIFLQSHGGDFEAALEMGRIIHKNAMSTAVAASSFSRCPFNSKVPKDCGFSDYSVARDGYANAPGSYCEQACVIVQLAGDLRIAQDSTLVRVSPLSPDNRVPFEEYLIELHQSFQIVREMDAARSSGSNTIQLAQREKDGLATRADLTLDYLIGADQCIIFGKFSANCVDLRTAKKPQ